MLQVIANLALQLNATSKSTILAATSVCSRWHALAQRIIDNTVGPLTIGKKTSYQNLELFRRLKKDAAFRRRVHHLSIGDWHLSGLAFDELSPYRPAGYFTEDWSEAERYADQTWPQIEGLIQVLPKLSLASFTWKALPFMPQPLTKALEATDCEISIQRNEANSYAIWFYDVYINPKGLQNLHGIASRLFELELSVPAADAELLSRIGTLIRLTRSLRKLGIYAASRMRMNTQLARSLQGTRHATFCTVDNMSWLCLGHTEPSPEPTNILRLSSLELTNFCICSIEQAKWIESIEWHNLRALRLTCIGLLRCIRSRLRGLKYFDMYLSPNDNRCEHQMCSSKLGVSELREALQELTHLEHLRITNGTEIIQQALDALPLTLKGLDIHKITPPIWPSPPRPLLAAESLEYIGKTFPLESLGCDAPYSDLEVNGCARFPLLLADSVVQYRKFLDKVSKSVRTLKSLKIYRENEQYGTDRADPPRSGVTLNSVSADLLEIQDTSPNLSQLSVHVGSTAPFDRDTELNKTGRNVYLQSQRRLEACTGHPRPIVRCLEVETMQSAVFGGVTFLAASLDIKTLLALNGPQFHWKRPRTP